MLKTARGRFSSVAFSLDGKTVAAGWRDFGPGEKAGVVLWDLVRGREIGILKGPRRRPLRNLFRSWPDDGCQ